MEDNDREPRDERLPSDEEIWRSDLKRGAAFMIGGIAVEAVGIDLGSPYAIAGGILSIWLSLPLLTGARWKP